MASQGLFSQIRRAFSKSSTPSSYGAIPESPSHKNLTDPSDDSSSTLSAGSEYGPDHADDAASNSSQRKPFISPRLISDATIGLSDGLTVPFALTAGLSALGDSKLVIYGGMAELFAGAISMGVGGYLGARSECQAYSAALTDTQRTVKGRLAEAKWQVRSAMSDLGLSESTLSRVIGELSETPEAMEKFIMRYYHDQTDASGSPLRAYASGLTIALGYFLGGLLPLLPYLFCDTIRIAFYWSCGVMLNILFIFGCTKTWLIDGHSAAQCLWSGLQMVVLGGLSAGAAWGCVAVIGTK